jgi:hypothetical protein
VTIKSSNYPAREIERELYISTYLNVMMIGALYYRRKIFSFFFKIKRDTVYINLPWRAPSSGADVHISSLYISSSNLASSSYKLSSFICWTGFDYSDTVFFTQGFSMPADRL